MAGLLGLALVAALAVAVRLSLGGEAAPEPVAATPAPAVASAPVVLRSAAGVATY